MAASKTPEIGVLDVQLTEDGASGVFFDGLPEIFPALQWHGAEVTRMPEGAICMATSPACACQAMRWHNTAYSLQFHVEVEDDTVDNWNAIPTYADALKGALGAEGPQIMRDACAGRMREFATMAERLYINWLQTAAKA